MRNYITILYLATTLFVGCDSRGRIQETVSESGSADYVKAKSNSSDLEKSQEHKFDPELLTGTWAEREDENAFFFIKNDSVYYIDSQDKGYHVEIKSDTLIFHLDGFDSKSKLIKLTKDSLIYQTEYGNIDRLYNRGR